MAVESHHCDCNSTRIGVCHNLAQQTKTLTQKKENEMKTTKIFILFILVVLLTSCGVVPNTSATQAVPTQTEIVIAPPVVPTDAATEIVSPTEAPATSTTVNEFNNVAEWTIEGSKDLVDPSVVSQANGDDAFGNHFDNAVGLGSQMIIAEPGTLLVGPGFDPAIMAESDGRIDWISPITQQMLGTETFSTNTAEGAFTWATGAKMTVKVRDFTITVNSGEACSNNWFVMIRGLFADGQQDSDRNSTTHFSNYVAGHTQVMWYPAGAYISEENFLQVAELSHTDGRNCGKEGTSGLSVLMLDLNTGAYTILYQANLNEPWQFIASNWFKQ